MLFEMGGEKTARVARLRRFEVGSANVLRGGSLAKYGKFSCARRQQHRPFNHGGYSNAVFQMVLRWIPPLSYYVARHVKPQLCNGALYPATVGQVQWHCEWHQSALQLLCCHRTLQLLEFGHLPVHKK